MVHSIFRIGVSFAALTIAGASAQASAQANMAASPTAVTEQASLDDIVVVARRAQERLQDVPISITAISAETIKTAQISQGSDLIRLVPTLNVQQSSTGPGQSYSLRGIRTGVITYFNEVPTSTNAVNNQMWDLESVQALAGPQGTLFGRNSTGGAILFVPARPTGEFEGSVELGYGNYDWRQATAVLNLPVADAVSLRVGGRIVRRDGVVKNEIGPDFQSQHRDSFRASLLLEPGSVFSNYTVFDYTDVNEAPGALITSNVRPTAGCFPGLGCLYGTQPAELGAIQDELGIRRVRSRYPAIQDSKEWGVTNIAAIEPTEGITLKYVFGLRRSSYNRFTNQTTLDLPIQIGNNFQDFGRVISHEVQALGNVLDGRLNWAIGIFRSKQESRGGLSYSLFGNPNLPFSNDRNNFTTINQSQTTTGVYGQATITLADGLNVTGGLRFNKDKAALLTSSVGPQFTFFGPQICRFSPTAPGVDFANCTRSISDNYDAVTYNFSVDYRVSSAMLLYVTTRRGYNSGGFNPSVPASQEPSAPQPSFGPEYIRDYEAGIKADWHIGSMPVRTNLSGFYGKYTSIQRSTFGVSSTGATFIGTSNGPKATIYGFQLESTIRPAPGFLLNANYGLLETRYDEGSPGFPKGNAFAQAPKHTVNLSASYTHDLGNAGKLVASTGFTYQSRISFQDDNLGSSLAFQKGYSIVDARLGMSDIGETGLSASLFVKNLTNEAYALERQDLVNAFGFAGTIYNDPRTFGLEIGYRFGAN